MLTSLNLFISTSTLFIFASYLIFVFVLVDGHEWRHEFSFLTYQQDVKLSFVYFNGMCLMEVENHQFASINIYRKRSRKTQNDKAAYIENSITILNNVLRAFNFRVYSRIILFVFFFFHFGRNGMKVIIRFRFTFTHCNMNTKQPNKKYVVALASNWQK